MSGIGDDEGERLWGRGGPKLDDDDDDDEYDDNGNAYDGEESDPLASDDDADVTRDEEAEELFGASVETLLAERNGGGKRRRRASGARGAKRRPSEVPRHLTARMGAATVAYMKQNFAEAEELLLKIIQEAPKAVDPYKNLALICEERGDMEKSLSYLMFAAHLDRQDRDLWKRCASRWFEAGDNDQAIYCLTMALKGTNGQDTEALRARAAVFEAASQWRKAGENYVKLLKAEPGNLGVAIQLCNVFIKDGKPLKAEPYLEQTLSHLEQYPPKFTQRDDVLAHEASLSTVVQRIVEIRFSQDRYEDAAKLLAHHQSRRTLGDIQPFLERVMHGVCQHRVGSRALASVTFNEFFADEGISNANPTLMWHVAEACFAGRDHLKTIKAYSALISHPEYTQQPRMFLRRAEAYMQLGNAVQAEKDVRRALDIVPESVEAKVYLSRITGEAGSRSLRTGDGSQAGATALGSREMTPHPAGGRRDMLRDALYATEQSVQRQKQPKKKDSVNVLLALVADLAAAAKSALDKGGVAPYLSVLGPPVEAALGLPDGVLRSNWTDESVLVGDCIQQDLIAKVQVMGEDLKALGQAFLRSLSDTAYVAFLERVLDCTMLHGAFGDGTNVVEVLAAARGHRIRSGERCLKLRTRAACLASMICGGDIERAYDDMRNLVRDYPSDTRIWWLHAQFDPYLTSLRDPGFRSRINQSLTRDAKREFKDPSFGAASIGSVMASGVYSVRGRGHMITPRPAARCFAFVHRRVPEVPSAALGVAVNLLSMARSRSAVNREQLILKAFTYMDEYRRRRRQQFESMPRCTRMFVENEIDYNVARALHDIGLVYLAADLYSCILDGSRGAELDGQTDVSSESALDLLPAWLDIRREAAFNLVHIYEASGQSELAGALVRKYLVF